MVGTGRGRAGDRSRRYLLDARIVTGSIHGLFIGVALAVAASLVPPERMGRAISVVLGGIAVSTVLGVPLGTLIGQAIGWQAAFVAIVILGAIALVSTLLFVPPVENAGTGGLATQVRHALAPRVLVVLGVGFLLLGGQFAALTYLTPFLGEVTGISGGLISVFLLAYGVANAVGTFAGGWAADRGATTTLVVANVVLIGALGMLYLVGSTPILVALALGVWGLVGFGLVPIPAVPDGRAGRSRGQPCRDAAGVRDQRGDLDRALVDGWAIATYVLYKAIATLRGPRLTEHVHPLWARKGQEGRHSSCRTPLATARLEGSESSLDPFY